MTQNDYKHAGTCPTILLTQTNLHDILHQTNIPKDFIIKLGRKRRFRSHWGAWFELKTKQQTRLTFVHTYHASSRMRRLLTVKIFLTSSTNMSDKVGRRQGVCCCCWDCFCGLGVPVLLLGVAGFDEFVVSVTVSDVSSGCTDSTDSKTSSRELNPFF